MKRNKKSAPASTLVHVNPADVPNAEKRTFPGPPNARSPLRVAVNQPAFDAVMAHARESLSAEVCGVLVGQVCQDESGVFTHISHAIRGEGAAEGSTHVTFTQATWTTIHATMDREHTGRSIVGWYHTHPGFGVEFSDMDIFVQRNFFNGAAQVALVTDPKDGAVAIAMNAAERIQYLDRFWLDGREHPARVPEALQQAVTSNESGGLTAREVRNLEERVVQLTQAVDDMRNWLHWLLLVCGAVVCAGVITFIGMLIREQFRARISPPEYNSVVPIPVKIGDKSVLLGVSLTQWDVPPELNGIMLDLAREEAEAKEEAKKKASSKQQPEKE